jgi:IMP dehydrogenase
MEKLIDELKNLGILEFDQVVGYYINPIYKQELFPRSFSFDDIAISQQKNIVRSRLDVDIKSEFIRGFGLDVPLIAANMSTVVNASFAISLYKLGALGILHRAQPENSILEEVKLVAKECNLVAASIGIEDDQFELAKKIISAGANILTIDIANGYSDKTLEIARKIKQYSKDIKIIIGNTTNIGLLSEAADVADAIKVGIAQGYACETKNTAGCTELQFSAVYKFKELSRAYGIPIISDGSIREPADFVKAIAAGANSVMAGKIFAACPESAAEIELVDNVQKKVYAGMASRYVQNKWKGGLKAGTCPEGGVRYLNIGENVEKLIERYSGALKSGISYSTSFNIDSFQKNVKFIRLK